MPPRSTRAASVLRAVALACALVAPQAARAQTTDLPEELRTIADVQFRGMHAVKARQMKAAGLHTQRPSALPWREKPTLRRDYLSSDSSAIRSLYAHYGYIDAHVDVRIENTRDPRAARVVFVIAEGPRSRIASVTLSGLSAYPENEMRHALFAQKGLPFDAAFLQLDTLRIRALYRERGYFVNAEAGWDRRKEDSTRVDVRYHVDEGPRYHVGPVDFPETPHVRASLGRRELLVHTGDVYRENQLSRSIERLYQTALWRQVQVTPVRDDTAGTVALDFLVSERKRRWVDGAIGSGTTDRFRVTSELGHRNLDTRALAGVVSGELAYYGTQKQHTGLLHRAGGLATLTEPWLLGIRLQGQTAVFDRYLNDRIYATTDESVDPIYVQKSVTRGFNFSLYRELGRYARVTLTQENTFVTQDYRVLKGANQTLGDSLIAVISDSLAASALPRYHSNTLRLTVERDLRNDRIAPTRGSYQQAVGELAGGPLHGQSSYRKGQIASTWYTPFKNRWNLAVRASGGVMAPFGTPPDNFSPEVGVDSFVTRVPRESRFFVGGVNSLRGYGENAVPAAGGLAMLLANVEVRIPVVGPLGVEAFVDAGNVWARPEYIRARDFVAPWQATRARDGDLRYSYGLGSRLLLPFGPLRVDLAWSDRPDFPRPDKPWKIRVGQTTWKIKPPFVFQFAIGPSF